MHARSLGVAASAAATTMAVAVLGLVAARPAAAALPDARALFERHLAVSGGREALEAHASLTLRGFIALSGPVREGAYEREGSYEQVAVAPSASVQRASIPGLGDLEEGCLDELCYLRYPGSPPSVVDGPQAWSARLGADFLGLHATAFFTSLETVGVAAVGGRAAYEVEARADLLPPERWLFDAETGLLVVHRHANYATLGSTMVEHTTDYCVAGDILVPSRIEVDADVDQLYVIETALLDDPDARVPLPALPREAMAVHTLAGRVEEEGAPVAEAQVRVEGEVGTRAVTDPEGRFRMALRGERYNLVARSRDRTGSVSGTFPPAGDLDGIVIPIEPRATVSGRITDPDGEPVSGALVFIESAADDRGMTWSDEQGRFELLSSASGRTRIHVNADGYATSVTRVSAVRGATTEIAIRLIRTTHLTGVVRYDDGTPAAARSVTLRFRALGEARADSVSATTDAKGAFDLAGPPSGHARLTWGPKDDALELELPAGPLELTLPAGNPLEGVVLFEDGSPGARASVLACLTAGTEIRGCDSTETDESGHFHLEHVADGVYRLESAVRRARVALEALALPRDAAASPLVLRLDRGRTMSGQVRDLEGRPVAHASVSAHTASQELPEDRGYSQAYTDDAGRFELEGLGAADYELEARSISGSDASSATLAARPPATDLEFTLDPGVELTGRLRGTDGRPIASCSIAGVPSSDDAGGVFRVRVPSTAGPSITVKARGYRETSIPVEDLAGKDRVDLGTLSLEPTARLRGRVVSARTGEPIEGASLVRTSEEAGDLYAETDARGEFVLLDAPETPFEIEVSADGYRASGPVRMSLLASPTILLGEGAVIAGKVRDQRGRPVADVMVQARGAGDGPGGGGAHAMTDEDGAYRLAGLEAGGYTVEIMRLHFMSDAGRFQSAQEVVLTDPSATLALDLVLKTPQEEDAGP